MLLNDKAVSESAGGNAGNARVEIPAWLQDYTLLLLNQTGDVLAWYSGAERIYGYRAAQIVGRNSALIYPAEESLHGRLSEELNRSVTEGHFGNECWCMRKDGTRFWANAITTVLPDENGDMQGFARLVRDFAERHDRDTKLRRARASPRPMAMENMIAGMVSGECDRIPEANDAFLEIVAKLLRGLQEKSFERLGSTKTIPIDVRLVAATNHNLTQMMGDKLFRSDLYYRLKVFPITTPPLRDRPEDIQVLARHFTQKYARAMDKEIEKIPTDAMRVLVSWPWPGNVRELESFIKDFAA